MLPAVTLGNRYAEISVPEPRARSSYVDPLSRSSSRELGLDAFDIPFILLLQQGSPATENCSVEIQSRTWRVKRRKHHGKLVLLRAHILAHSLCWK